MSLLREEWPSAIIEELHPDVIALAQEIREVTGCVMIPSPVERAHVRREIGGSTHNTNEGTRLATGTDLFLRNEQAKIFWALAQTSKKLGGFGIYFDKQLHSEKRVMVHLDTRDTRVKWVCPSKENRTDPSVYIYYNHEPELYLRTLADEFDAL